MRRYYDVGLIASSSTEAESLVGTAASLGFKGVAVELTGSRVEGLRDVARGVEVYSRITVLPRSVNELYVELRRARWRHHVVAVRAFSREVLMAALRDSRVDLVVAPVEQMIPIDGHVAEVARNAVELRLAEFLRDPRSFASWLFRSSRWIERGRVRVVVTSGASDWLGMRRPVQLASLLTGTGFRPELALDSVSRLPEAIVIENARRLSGLSDPRGVWSVEGEEEVPGG
ncbi:MAG: RNase P subunit p30 family protein [Candidatus Caldarchaeales archaeon]